MDDIPRKWSRGTRGPSVPPSCAVLNTLSRRHHRPLQLSPLIKLWYWHATVATVSTEWFSLRYKWVGCCVCWSWFKQGKIIKNPCSCCNIQSAALKRAVPAHTAPIAWPQGENKPFFWLFIWVFTLLLTTEIPHDDEHPNHALLSGRGDDAVSLASLEIPNKEIPIQFSVQFSQPIPNS